MFRKSDQPLDIARFGVPCDFLTEVDPERLRLIAAITLQWNWIETGVDELLAISLNLRPDMWVQVQSRINGFDGKVGIIKAGLLSLSGRPSEPWMEPVHRALGAAESYKTIRDHIIHMRLRSPDEEVSDTYQRRGAVKEVYAAIKPLQAFYSVLRAHWDEIDALRSLYVNLAMLRLISDAQDRPQLIEAMKDALVRLLESQQIRESLPPLPEVPEPETSPVTPQAVVDPRELSD